MIKKFLMVSLLVIVASFCMTYVTFPRCGGDAFVGSLGGSLVGSAIGTSMAQRPSTTTVIERRSSDDGRALRAVDKLEDVMDREVAKLNNKIAKLEKRIEKLESQRRKEKQTEVVRESIIPETQVKKVPSKKIIAEQ